MGYGCHPETSQGIIARKRLGERLLKREIYVQMRRAICTERTGRKTPKQIHSVSGTHNLDAPDTGATNFFCGEDSVRVIHHRLRRQLTPFAASKYVLHRRRGRFRRRPHSACFLGRAIEDSARSHPRYSRCPSSTRAHLEKYLLHFLILPALTANSCRTHDVCLCCWSLFSTDIKAKGGKASLVQRLAKGMNKAF